MQKRIQAFTHLPRYQDVMSCNQVRVICLIRRLRMDVAEVRQNLNSNVSRNRPTVTDPDPFTTPDPMEPQLERYETPSSVAQSGRSPIGFRPGREQGESRGATCRSRQPRMAQSIEAPSPLTPRKTPSPVSSGTANP